VACELSGKTAVVTGSTAGIGRAIALELASAGAALVVHGRRAEAADEVAAEIRARGGDALVIMADLADPATHEPLVEQAWNWRDGIDIWVHNAGADVLTGDAAGWSFDEKLEVLWQVDVRAAVRLCRLVGGA
jgi:3-oxoacyl-[acyl-carrier protein] reductase